MRGIFRLTDFHLQSGDVTFVWGNEIALQQTVGYIIPSQAHILLPFFFFFFLYQWLFLTLFISPRDTKKPVSQDQLVTSRELWSGEGAEETKATAMLASRRGDKVTWSSFQAINVTSSPCPGKVDLTAEWCPARTWRENTQKSSRFLWHTFFSYTSLLISLSVQLFSFSGPLSPFLSFFKNSISLLSWGLVLSQSFPPSPSLS